MIIFDMPVDLSGMGRETVPLFLQWDPMWGYEDYGSSCIAVTGCSGGAFGAALLTDDVMELYPECGNIISVSHNHQIAQQVSQDAVSNIFITLKPNTKETDDFLQCKTYDDEKDFPPSAFGKLTQNQLEKIEGTIPKDSKVQEFIPEIIKKDFSEKIDWNYNTVLSTVQKFDILRPKHPELKMKDFWQALLRGGIQGA